MDHCDQFSLQIGLAGVIVANSQMMIVDYSQIRLSEVQQNPCLLILHVSTSTLKMLSMPPLPEDYLPRICSKLELSPKVEGAARDLLRAAQDVPLTNSVPISLAAAAVYIASIVNNERRKQKDVARAADLTEVTIRSRYKEMAQFLNIDIHI